MLCDICKKRTATTYYKQIVNDSITELHLCSECAANQGYSNIFGGFSNQLEKMFGSVFTLPQAMQTGTKRCSVCNMSFDDIVKTGRVGCTHCYTEFYDKILPSIKRIHGNTYHVGKKPVAEQRAIRVKPTLEILREQMNEAVTKQEFEKAAELRDKIRNLEDENNE